MQSSILRQYFKVEFLKLFMTFTYPYIKNPNFSTQPHPWGPLSPTGELGQLFHAAGQETEPSAETEAVNQT